MTIKRGDVVKLKSSGPLMTVTGTDENTGGFSGKKPSPVTQVECKWFRMGVRGGSFEREVFSPHSLEVVTEHADSPCG